MENSYEHQIFIGCYDLKAEREAISESRLREMITYFFESRKIDFSMLSCQGGYLHEEGWFITENSICIDVIGDPDLDVISLAKKLSVYLNQESILVVRNALKTDFC